MLRILHLYPAKADFQTRRCVELLLRDLGPGWSGSGCSIGYGGDVHNLAGAVLRLRAAYRGQTDVVHAWGAVELAAAVLSGFRRVVFTAPETIDRDRLGWLAAILRWCGAEVVCPTEDLRRAFVEQGIPMRYCHAIHPAIDPTRRHVGPQARLRAELGFAESDYVLLAPGESTRAADHHRAVWCAGILKVVDERCRLLSWGRGPLVESLNGFCGRLRQPELLVQAERRLGREIEFEELAGVADAVVAVGAGRGSTLAIGVCMAAEVPIVAGKSSTICEILEDNRTALLAARPTPLGLAQRVQDLRRDRALRLRITEAARSAAAGYFSKSAYLGRYKEIYQRVASLDGGGILRPTGLVTV